MLQMGRQGKQLESKLIALVCRIPTGLDSARLISLARTSAQRFHNGLFLLTQVNQVLFLLVRLRHWKRRPLINLLSCARPQSSSPAQNCRSFVLDSFVFKMSDFFACESCDLWHIFTNQALAWCRIVDEWKVS